MRAMLHDLGRAVWSNVEIAKTSNVSRGLVQAVRGSDSHHAERQDGGPDGEPNETIDATELVVRKAQPGDTVYGVNVSAVSPPRAEAGGT
jgi:hypothetical protein